MDTSLIGFCHRPDGSVVLYQIREGLPSWSREAKAAASISIGQSPTAVGAVPMGQDGGVGLPSGTTSSSHPQGPSSPMLTGDGGASDAAQPQGLASLNPAATATADMPRAPEPGHEAERSASPGAASDTTQVESVEASRPPPKVSRSTRNSPAL